MEEIDILNLGKDILIKNEYNLAVLQDEKVVFHSKKPGIVPMYDFYNSNISGDVYIIDKFIGLGAARLILNSKSNVLGIFTFVISKDALKLLEDHNIPVEYDRMVTKILNKNKDDLCPVEKLSINNENFEDFYGELGKFIENMKQK